MAYRKLGKRAGAALWALWGGGQSSPVHYASIRWLPPLSLSSAFEAVLYGGHACLWPVLTWEAKNGERDPLRDPDSSPTTHPVLNRVPNLLRRPRGLDEILI